MAITLVYITNQNDVQDIGRSWISVADPFTLYTINLYMYTKHNNLQTLLKADVPEYQHFKRYNPLLL
jgi:hypothetical protein